MIHRATHEQAQVAAVVHERAHEADGLRRVVHGDRVEQRARLLPVSRTEQLVHVLDADLALGERRDLVEDALGVTERALGVARDRLERRRLNLHLLFLRDHRELLDHRLVRDPAEVEPLRPGHDRGRDLLRFGRREHENDVRRRLLEGLQQGVEGVARELMGLVDDIHLVLALGRRETHLFA